jgi:hypothetical protein
MQRLIRQGSLKITTTPVSFGQTRRISQPKSKLPDIQDDQSPPSPSSPMDSLGPPSPKGDNDVMEMVPRTITTSSESKSFDMPPISPRIVKYLYCYYCYYCLLFIVYCLLFIVYCFDLFFLLLNFLS